MVQYLGSPRNIPSPGDSSRDLFIPKRWVCHDSPLSSGHVFTHHPKKVTKTQNCQVHVTESAPNFKKKSWKTPGNLVTNKSWNNSILIACKKKQKTNMAIAGKSSFLIGDTSSFMVGFPLSSEFFFTVGHLTQMMAPVEKCVPSESTQKKSFRSSKKENDLWKVQQIPRSRKKWLTLKKNNT